MNFKPEKYEIGLALEREEIAAEFFGGRADESTMCRLYQNISEMLLTSKGRLCIFDASRLVDSVLGAAVVLCAGRGVLIETELNGGAIAFDDMRLWELSLLTFVRELCETGKDRRIKLVADFGKSDFRLRATYGCETVVFRHTNRLVSKIGGRIVEIYSSRSRLACLIIPKRIKHNKNENKNSRPARVGTAADYLSDPFSIAYIALYSVCENPIFTKQRWDLNIHAEDGV